MGGCEARTQGALVSNEIRARPRTPPRAAQRVPAAQLSFWNELLNCPAYDLRTEADLAARTGTGAGGTLEE